MRIRLEYYGWLTDQTGRRDEELETGAATVADLLRELVGRYAIDPHRAGHFRAAVNDDFTALDHPLREGDLVVFIPPVSGG